MKTNQTKLREVIKILSRRSGKANLEVDIYDGVAEVKMSFSIKLWANSMVSSSWTKPEKKRKRKGPSQITCDRKCAQSFHSNKILNSAIVLPFSGQLLPVNNDDADDAAGGESSAKVVESTPLQIGPPKNCHVPTKSSCIVEQSLTEVRSALKELFPASQPIVVVDTSTMCQTPSYQKRESELMLKLFN